MSKSKLHQNPADSQPGASRGVRPAQTSDHAVDPEKRAAVLQLIQDMRTIPTEGEYFALTLTATEIGSVHYSWYSHWSSFSKTTPRRELRKPSQVDPTKMARLWWDVGQSCVAVRTTAHLALYLRIGGNALVERKIVATAFKDIAGAAEVGFAGMLEGPVSIASADPQATQRAPTPRLRMDILKRDEFRCRACGRGPRDNVDIELHVHHIVPWADGGLTLRGNLITLCHTCHVGLHPHREWTLFGVLSATEPMRLPDTTHSRAAHSDGVARYRGVVSRMLDASAKNDQGSARKAARRKRA